MKDGRPPQEYEPANSVVQRRYEEDMVEKFTGRHPGTSWPTKKVCTDPLTVTLNDCGHYLAINAAYLCQRAITMLEESLVSHDHEPAREGRQRVEFNDKPVAVEWAELGLLIGEKGASIKRLSHTCGLGAYGLVAIHRAPYGRHELHAKDTINLDQDIDGMPLREFIYNRV